MKRLFPGFYRQSKAELELLWRDATFVLDANVLLNLYRYPLQARDELLEVFSLAQERLWIPFQAALEYQRNRVNVIAEQQKRFRDVRGIVAKVVPTLEGDLSKLQIRLRHSLIEVDGLLLKISSPIKEFEKELDRLEREQLTVQASDPIRDKLDILLEGRVGPAPEATQIEGIVKDGKDRFGVGMPPGLRDKPKSSDQTSGFYSYGGCKYEGAFGDLIIWKQIIDYAKSYSVKNMIFLTDDEKDDWWLSVDSSGPKKLGPRPELVEEIRREAGVENFHMYNSVSFLRFARSIYQDAVSQSSIDQVEEVSAANAGASQGTEGQQAVYNWLKRTFPDEYIDDKSIIPDFVVHDDLGKHAFEVLTIPAFVGRDNVTYAEQRLKSFLGFINGEDYDRIEFIVVIEGRISKRSLAVMARRLSESKGRALIRFATLDYDIESQPMLKFDE